MTTLLSLPVAKYSYATGSNAQGVIPWTHLIRDDIDILFEALQFAGLEGANRSKVNLKVVQGLSTLVMSITKSVLMDPRPSQD